MDINKFTKEHSPLQSSKGAKGFLKQKKEEARMTLRILATTVINCMSQAEKEDSYIDSKKLKLKLLTFSLAFALGISEISLGVFPFGIGYFCAAKKELALPAFAGVAFSCLFAKEIAMIQFVTLVLVFLLRKTFTADKFDEKVRTKVITILCTSIFLGTIMLFITQRSNITTFITYISLTTLTGFLFCHLFSDNNKRISDGVYITAIYASCICLIPSFNRISIWGIDMGLIFSGVCTLLFSSALGPVYGCVMGFLSGFACTNPLYSACLGLAGLSSGFIRRKNFALSALLFPVFSSIVCIYLMGINSVLKLCPFVLCSSAIFLIFGKNTPSFLEFSIESKRCDYTVKNEKRADNFGKISDSLSGLSNILYKFAEHFKAPSEAETADIFDNALNEICKSCSMNEMCYAKRQANLDNVRKKVVKTLQSGLLHSDELSHLLLDKCIKTTDLCDYINKHYSELNFITMKSNRTQTVACLYNSMSHLIRTAGKDEAQNNNRDMRLEKKISEALTKIGMEFSTVYVYGNRTKNIYVHNIRTDKIPCSSRDLCKYLSDECGVYFNEPSFDLSDSADTVMKLTRSEIIGLEYAQCCSAKTENTVNGDTVNFFDTDSGYFYCLICDGMGSGKSAAATSRLSGVFLEKLLSAGTRKNVCLEMLNNLLLSKNDETFSTVDVLEVDKLCGTAYFIKAGAAPSFILRRNKLYKIASETPPVGIIHAFTAESTKFTLEKGDVIFMVSDGVIQSNDDAIWLSEIIRVDTRNEPAILASELIEKARIINTRRDDASVCIIKVI